MELKWGMKLDFFPQLPCRLPFSHPAEKKERKPKDRKRKNISHNFGV